MLIAELYCGMNELIQNGIVLALYVSMWYVLFVFVFWLNETNPWALPLAIEKSNIIKCRCFDEQKTTCHFLFKTLQSYSYLRSPNPSSTFVLFHIVNSLSLLCFWFGFVLFNAFQLNKELALTICKFVSHVFNFKAHVLLSQKICSFWCL